MFNPLSVLAPLKIQKSHLLACVLPMAVFAAAGGFATSALAAVPEVAAPKSLIIPTAPGAKPKVYGLVSAVGAQLNIVRQKQQAGSNLDPFERNILSVPDQRLNFTVLRAVDRAVARVDPQAQRVMMQFAAPTLDGVAQNQRHEVAAKALFDALKGVSERQQWDEIIAITPRYSQLGEGRMGNRLWGIGLYVQPLGSNSITGQDGFGEFIDSEEDTVSTKGEMASATTFVAPFAYLTFTVLDAKTLKVIRVVETLDSRKVADKNCEALDVFKCFDAEQYGTMVERIAERAAVRGVTGSKGTVEMPLPTLVPVVR